MKKIFILLVLIYSFCFSKEVLLLHSYHKGYKWSDDISKAIEEKFKSYDNIELTTIYMDTKRVAGPLYLDKLANLYKIQLKKRNFDLIIASDNNAFEFVIRYHEYLFKNLPVLFTGINNFDKALLDENHMIKYMSGVVEQVDIEKNFNLILKLHPKLKNLLILNDKSKTGYAVKRDLRSIIKKYKKRINIEYIDNMNIKKIKQKVKNLDKNSVIFFILFFQDISGKFFTYKQSFKAIKDVSSVPIYGLWDFYLDYGMIGGLLTSAKAQGEAVANMALKVLNGVKIKDIPILNDSPNKYIFDYKELNKFNINIKPFLDEYEIINEPNSLYKEHTKFVILSLLLIFILSVIVLIMKVNIKRRKKVENELSNQLKFEKVLLETLPNAIYYKNKEGKIISCNKSFCQLFNLKKDEVIGKTAYDFYPKDIAKKNSKIDEEILKTQVPNSSELTIHFSNKQMKFFILNKAVYKNISGNIGGIVCIMDDITERVQQKQFLIQQSKLAEMGDMVAAIAHQWNEPLVELSAQVQDIQTSYMLDELENISIEEFVNDSMVQIQYMSKTLSDFRNFLKPSTKKAMFSLAKSFEEIFEIISKQVFYSNITLSHNYKHYKKKLMIFGYENEFKQVLLNIINNAKNKIIQKNEKNEEFKGEISINVSQEQNYNIILISDNAGAIKENIIDSIFDPYFTTKKDGTGIGLYMAKVIIEDKMAGFISVCNNKHKVIFTIKLPNKQNKS